MHTGVGRRGSEGGRAGPLRRLSGWGRRRSAAGRAKEQERRPVVRLAMLAAARGGEAGAMRRSPGGEGSSGPEGRGRAPRGSEEPRRGVGSDGDGIGSGDWRVTEDFRRVTE